MSDFFKGLKEIFNAYTLLWIFLILLAIGLSWLIVHSITPHETL